MSNDANKNAQPLPAVVTLVAVERGFMDGCMIEPGKKFSFKTTGRDGKARKLPKWAVREDDPRLAKKATPWDGNLKPTGAKAAAKEKREGLDNDIVG